MKSINLLKIKTALWLSFSILVIMFCGCTKLSVDKQAETQTQFNEPKIEGEFEGDVEKREDWFMRQRTYPFSTVPEDARREAWLSRPEDAVGENGLALEPWQPIGPTPTISFFSNNWGVTSGRINAIAVSPSNPQLILIGAATGGIWRSTNGGNSFTPTSDNQVDLAVGSIAFAPSNPLIVYAGMGDTGSGYNGTGVLKSTDGGQSWTRVNNTTTLPSFGRISKIEVDPNNPNRVYLAQYTSTQGQNLYYGGFFYSTDGGVNWTRTITGSARDLVRHPTQPNTLYLALEEFYNGQRLRGGVFKSTNAGLTWISIYTSPFTNTANIKIAVTPAAPQNIAVLVGYASHFDTNLRRMVYFARVELSSNEGTTWTNRGSGFDTAQFEYNCYLFIHPTNPDTLFVGTRDLWLSTNAGNSYYNITKNFNITNNFEINNNYDPRQSKAHPDQHHFYISPTNPTTTYLANDGGLYRSTNNTVTYQSLNNSLSLTMFTSLDLHPTDATKSYGGTQDNGTQRRMGNSSWAEFSTGDGGQTVIDALDPSIVYTTYTSHTVYRYTNNGGGPETEIGYNTIFANDRVAFYPPLVGNGVNSNLYFGTYRLYVSTNRGTSWIAPGGTLDLTYGNGVGDTLSAIGVGRSNTNVIYTGSEGGRLMVSTNGGANWTDRTAGLPRRFIKTIIVSPTNANTAYVTVSGYGSGHVFKTVNAGASWTDISGNLPNIPTNTLLIDPNTPTTIYVGTDVGVFRTTTDGNTWATFNDGMPPVIISELDMQANGLLQAATYGRGAFQINPGTIGCASPSPIAFGQNVNGNLQNGDCVYTDGSFYDAYTFNGTAGQKIYITLNSTQFNAYLLFYQGSYPGGALLTQDNNGGGGTNARIPATSGFLTLPATGNYTILANSVAAGESGNYTLYLGTDVTPTSRKQFDFDGDGKADVSVFRPANGVWYINQTANGLTGVSFGQLGDKIVPADYDGDGKTDVAVYRSGTWYLNRSLAGFTAVGFGTAEDIPQPADFNNDGRDELAVFRPSNGTWYVLNLQTNQFSFVQFGQNGDKPVVADYDGDGRADYAVYRNGSWYILRSSQGFIGIQFGISTDKPVPADYDGDGKADVAVFRQSNGTWYLNRSTAGFAEIKFGISGDIPAPADYDGDGRADIAVFRDGAWYEQRSTTGFFGIQFGAANDRPVPSAFVP